MLTDEIRYSKWLHFCAQATNSDSGELSSMKLFAQTAVVIVSNFNVISDSTIKNDLKCSI